jgi:transposase
MKTNETFLAELAAVRSALETWRRTRTHRRPIPPEIWEQVVPLARTHGVSRVSEALRLNYYALKRRLGAPKRARRRSGGVGASVLEGWAVIQITPQMRILLAVEPADFRKGIDGLAQLCAQKLKSDPLSGAMFVFSNKRRKALKILVYDGQGFWLCQKRLPAGRFTWWPQATDSATFRLDVHQVQLLLWNGNPQSAQAAPMWRSVGPGV